MPGWHIGNQANCRAFVMQGYARRQPAACHGHIIAGAQQNRGIREIDLVTFRHIDLDVENHSIIAGCNAMRREQSLHLLMHYAA